MVTLGESTTEGYSASSKERCWASLLAGMIADRQGQPVELINRGMGSNVLTPLCPAYPIASHPAGIERLERDVIETCPDLVLIAYGLNDARGGTPQDAFTAEYQTMLDRLRVAVPVRRVVLVGVHHVHEVILSHCPGWEHADRQRIEQFDALVREIAQSNGLVFADVYAAMARDDSLIHDDHCHPNDAGHRVIAACVFKALRRSGKPPAPRGS